MVTFATLFARYERDKIVNVIDRTKKEELDRLWQDERHWGSGSLGIYFCREDPRLVVPKRGLPGGTFNMAHAAAVPILTGIIVLLIILVIVLALY